MIKPSDCIKFYYFLIAHSYSVFLIVNTTRKSIVVFKECRMRFGKLIVNE